MNESNTQSVTGRNVKKLEKNILFSKRILMRRLISGDIEEMIPMKSEVLSKKIGQMKVQRAQIDADITAGVARPVGEVIIELTFDEQRRWDLYLKLSKDLKIECGRGLNLIKETISDEIFGEIKMAIPGYIFEEKLWFILGRSFQEEREIG